MLEAIALDSMSRKTLLFAKSNANRQRRQRELMLQTAPREIVQLLGDSSYVVTPATNAILNRFSPATADGIGTPNCRVPSGYSYSEFAWEAKALASLPKAERFPGKTAHLVLRSPDRITFNQQFILVPQLPIFLVDYCLALKMFDQLWTLAESSVALVAMDLSAGIVIDNYCGYLEDDFNPDEMVFEVARW
jgi:hypothetical protein